MPQSKSVMASVVGNEFINGDQTFDKFNGYCVVWFYNSIVSINELNEWSITRIVWDVLNW